MGLGLQVVSGYVTAPSTTFTAWTMGAGDSTVVRNAPDGSMVRLLQMWADNQAAGYLRVRSPSLHDNVKGMTSSIAASEVYPLIPDGGYQQLRPQDQLIVEQNGSATTADLESGSLLIQYDNVPGIDAPLKTWNQIAGKIESYMYVNNTLSLGTGGGYSGSQLITATDDQWKANRDYALIGYVVTAECCTVGWMGPDTGNLRLGGPGNETNRNLTRTWFKDLSVMYNLPLIPVFNAANKGATTIDGVQDENGTDTTVTSFFALLK